MKITIGEQEWWPWHYGEETDENNEDAVEVSAEFMERYNKFWKECCFIQTELERLKWRQQENERFNKMRPNDKYYHLLARDGKIDFKGTEILKDDGRDLCEGQVVFATHKDELGLFVLKELHTQSSLVASAKDKNKIVGWLQHARILGFPANT